MCMLQSCIARPKKQRDVYTRATGLEAPDFYIGNEAQRRRTVCKLTWPIKGGVIEDWDGMQKIWEHVVGEQLAMTAEDISGVVLTEPALNPAQPRERACQIWFETLDAPAFLLASQTLLSCIIRELSCGICVDSGEEVTTVTALYDSRVIESATWRIPIGGADCTAEMGRLLMRGGCYLDAMGVDRNMVMEVKKQCRVSLDFEDELDRLIADADPNLYTLPDGTSVGLQEFVIQVPELMFNPTRVGRDLIGLHKLVQQCVDACPLDLRSQLLGNVVLSGGNNLFPNLAPRLQSEVQALGLPYSTACVTAPESMPLTDTGGKEHVTDFSAWIGGTVLCELEDGPKWFTVAEYEEDGPRMIHKKML